MRSDAVAKRYANALVLEIGENAVKAEQYCAHLEGVCALFSVQEAAEILKNPTTSKQKKKELLSVALQEVQADDVLKGLCFTMLNADRIVWLPGVLAEAKRYLQSLKKEEHGVLTTATMISDEEVSLIANHISQKVGVTATLTNEVDPKVLAGFKVRLGMRSIDMTLRKKLQTLMGAVQQQK